MFATLERHSNFSICLEKSIPDHPTLIISRNDGNSKLTLAENSAKASYELHIFLLRDVLALFSNGSQGDHKDGCQRFEFA